jgi:hypothetical protein
MEGSYEHDSEIWFHIILGILWLAKEVVASQEVLYSVYLLIYLVYQTLITPLVTWSPASIFRVRAPSARTGVFLKRYHLSCLFKYAVTINYIN